MGQDAPCRPTPRSWRVTVVETESRPAPWSRRVARPFGYTFAMMQTMKRTSPPPGAGRKHKGDRKPYMARLPVALGVLVEERAEVEDLSYGDVIANAVAAYFQQAPVAMPENRNQLEMTA